MAIFIENKTTYFLDKKKFTQLKTTLRKAVKELKIEKLAEINLTFVNQRKIKKLNQEFFGKNTPTDVLSFSSKIPIKPKEIIGDIFICLKIADEQAKRLGHSLEEEIKILSCHGLLHLLGYNHQKPSEKKRWQMWEKRLTQI